jgi:tetratricopeptide (TPR) repeat protein
LKQTDERWWLGHAHWVTGLNHSLVGEFEQALEAQGRAHAVAEAIGDPRLQTFVAWVTGIVYAVIGEAEAAIQACQRGLEDAPDPLNKAITMGWLGFVYLQAGDPTRAIPVLEQAVEQLGTFGFRQLQSWFTVFLAEAHRATGHDAKAFGLATAGLQIATAAKFPVIVGWARMILGRAARARGALSEAETHLKTALQTFTSTHSRYELGQTHLDLAALARAQGNGEAVVSHLKEAHRVFTALRIPKDVERTEQLAREYGIHR